MFNTGLCAPDYFDATQQTEMTNTETRNLQDFCHIVKIFQMRA